MNPNGPFLLWGGKDALTDLIAGELVAGTDADIIARKVCEFLQPMAVEIAAESQRLGADIQCPQCNWVKGPAVDNEGKPVTDLNGKQVIIGATTFGGHLIHPCDSGCCNAQYCTECKKFWYLAEMTPKQAEHYVELVSDIKRMEAGDERKDGEGSEKVGTP